jgi:hypothetical protein
LHVSANDVVPFPGTQTPFRETPDRIDPAWKIPFKKR